MSAPNGTGSPGGAGGPFTQTAGAARPSTAAGGVATTANAGNAADATTAKGVGARDASQPGSVRIARRVLRSVVSEAALSVQGVAEMGRIGARWPQVLGRPFPYRGVGLLVHDTTVIIDLYLVVRPGANIVEVGSAVQEAVCGAVEHLLGMTVSAVNVFIQDVA